MGWGRVGGWVGGERLAPMRDAASGDTQQQAGQQAAQSKHVWRAAGSPSSSTCNQAVRVGEGDAEPDHVGGLQAARQQQQQQAGQRYSQQERVVQQVVPAGRMAGRGAMGRCKGRQDL